MLMWLAAAVLSFFVKGLTGFGDALVFGTALSFAADNVAISPVELLISSPANIIMCVKQRDKLSLKVCLPLIAVMLIGDIPGVLLLKNVQSGIIKVCFGLLIVGLGIEMLLREFLPPKPRKGSRVGMLLFGLLSGIVSGMFSVGALMAAYMSHVTDGADAFKGNVCLVFAVENCFRVILYAVMGVFTMPILLRALCCLPAMLAGLWLGMRAAKVLNPKTAKIVVVVMLVISGAALVINNL